MLAGFLGAGIGDVVSFVGGGGKTSLMLALAKELSKTMRVAVTTTTRMGRDELEGIPVVVGLDDLREVLRTEALAALIGSLDGRKVIGVASETVDACRDIADVVLVEADGSRRMPVKAPKDSEPVLPGSNTKTVLVYGFSGLNRPVGDVMYNPEGVPGLAGDAVITPALLRKITLNGGFLQKASRGKFYVVINQAETDPSAALEFARSQYHPKIARIALASAVNGTVTPVDNRDRDIVALVLAAGSSRRFSANKLVHPVKGEPLILHSLANLQRAGLEAPIVVVGHEEDAVLEVLGDRPGSIVKNPDHASGMASSLKKGVEAAGDAGAVLVMLGDMPGVTPGLIKTVINAYRDSCAWAARPQFSSKPGHPVVIGRELFPAVMALSGDTGARQVLGAKSNWVRSVEVDPATQVDIDTPDDLMRFKGDD